MVDVLNSKNLFRFCGLHRNYGWGCPTTNVGMVVEIEPGGWLAGFLFDDVMCAVSIQIPDECE
jgi:hypothetical protein